MYLANSFELTIHEAKSNLEICSPLELTEETHSRELTYFGDSSA